METQTVKRAGRLLTMDRVLLLLSIDRLNSSLLHAPRAGEYYCSTADLVRFALSCDFPQIYYGNGAKRAVWMRRYTAFLGSKETDTTTTYRDHTRLNKDSTSQWRSEDDCACAAVYASIRDYSRFESVSDHPRSDPNTVRWLLSFREPDFTATEPTLVNTVAYTRAIGEIGFQIGSKCANILVNSATCDGMA